MRPALITLRGVSRTYEIGSQQVLALQDVDLTIERGEFVAIVGTSGSGKSTLMNLIGCLDRPDAGQYLLNGRDTAELDEDELAAVRRETFGFIFQRYHLLPHQNALDNVALPAVYAGVPVAQRQGRAQALLEQFGLGDRLHHRPTELSGGQQQRVSIARALMNGGTVLLADEPTGALDSQSGAQTLEILQSLHRQGHTVIVVTHDARGLAARAERVVEISDGRITSDRRMLTGHPAESPQETGTAEPRGGLEPRSHTLWQRTVARAREAVQSAAQSIVGHKLRSVLSLIGVCIGITAVVAVVTISAAVQRAIDNELGVLFGGTIKVWTGNPRLPPGRQALPFSASDLEAVRGLPDVASVQIEMRGEMAARQGAHDARVKVHGAQATTLQVNRLRVTEGRGLSAAELGEAAQVAVIDHKVRDALFRPGEQVLGQTLFLAAEAGSGAPGGTADTGAEASTEPSLKPRSGLDGTPREFTGPALLPVRVVGIFAPASGSNFGREPIGELLIPRATFATKLDTRFQTREFTVVMSRPDQAQEGRQRITERLKALHGAEDFDTWNAASDVEALRAVMAVLAIVLGLVAAIALLVGGVGIMNIMLVSVTERTREIGIRMAVGARQADIRRQFLVESMLLCGGGGVLGLALCAGAAWVANLAQSRLHLQVDLMALTVAFAVSAAVGVLSGTWPAKRAAALSPVDALARE